MFLECTLRFRLIRTRRDDEFYSVEFVLTLHELRSIKPNLIKIDDYAGKYILSINNNSDRLSLYTSA